MDGQAAGERVVDGQIADGGRGVVASPLIHVSVHMEMDWIVSHRLLAHVLQLHPRDMNRPEAPLHLMMTADTFQSLLQGEQVVHRSNNEVQSLNAGKQANGCNEISMI